MTSACPSRRAGGAPFVKTASRANLQPLVPYCKHCSTENLTTVRDAIPSLSAQLQQAKAGTLVEWRDNGSISLTNSHPHCHDPFHHVACASDEDGGHAATSLRHTTGTVKMPRQQQQQQQQQAPPKPPSLAVHASPFPAHRDGMTTTVHHPPAASPPTRWSGHVYQTARAVGQVDVRNLQRVGHVSRPSQATMGGGRPFRPYPVHHPWMAQDNTHALPLVAEQRSTSIYDHPSACEIAQRLVTHDGSQLDAALVERLQFIGHTLFREGISRQWQRWTPEQRASVKAVLLFYPTHLPADRLRSPIVRQQCAAGQLDLHQYIRARHTPDAPYTAEMNEVAMQVAYILSEFLETSGDVLLQRLPVDTIAVLWRHGVVRLMRNASMDLVAAVLRGAAMCTRQLGPWAKLICATFRGWAM
ncbi:unnamed protein product [Vitrella brassicaformis CCMP3155]|uniref:Uncharacterized protein n=1 Tax=Vitrella brassicaformis (strain CCMP3155) TaxID=1169540 RepID=A0A0G4E8T6_VITBC|nr:unnamed protein product [Vitrella brassicaformis CCMP3155]|eukprot:CEL91612.1 unnamed protein product [Vitrella brassicaformis CCMP3155]